jgi:alpha-tubulin suppressor-like RCC1 family protein
MKRAHMDSGVVYSFGKEDHGKLGLGRSSGAALLAAAAAGSGKPAVTGQSGANRLLPTPVEQLRYVNTVALASLSTHSLAMSENGALYSWGNGDRYRLGHGGSQQEVLPRLVQTIPNKARVADVACGLGHTMVLTTTGQVYAWGNGANGRLGYGGTEDQALPVLVNFVNESSSAAASVAAAAAAAARSAPSTVNAAGATGSATSTASVTAVSGGASGLSSASLASSLSSASSASTATAAATSVSSTAAVSISSAAAAAAAAASSTAGNMTSSTTAASSTGSGSKTRGTSMAPVIVKIFCGASHSLALSVNGQAFAWGKNNQGQCGLGSRSDAEVPRAVTAFGGLVVVDMAGGWEHTLACTQAGLAFSFGAGYKDKRSNVAAPPVLGLLPVPERCLLPHQIENPFYNTRVVSVHCGWDHSMAITEKGHLYTWGAGYHGKLGHGNTDPVVVPQLVRALDGYDVVHAEGGCEHSMAICEPGLLFTWGQGEGGRLGHGDEQDQYLPKLVEGLVAQGLQAIHMAAGDKYSMVLLRQHPDACDNGKSSSSSSASGASRSSVYVEGLVGGSSAGAAGSGGVAGSAFIPGGSGSSSAAAAAAADISSGAGGGAGGGRKATTSSGSGVDDAAAATRFTLRGPAVTTIGGGRTFAARTQVAFDFDECLQARSAADATTMDDVEAMFLHLGVLVEMSERGGWCSRCLPAVCKQVTVELVGGGGGMQCAKQTRRAPPPSNITKQ